MVLIGVQPQSVDWGTEQTPAVTSTLAAVKEMVYTQIDSWSALISADP